MQVNGEKWNPEAFLNNIQERNEKKKTELEQEKERLKQKILDEWDQYDSIVFWNECFEFVPLDVIRRAYKNVNGLDKSGYPIRNKAGFFVSTLKRMGYFPFQERANGDEKKQ